jgi:pectin methylesterase-like acyl-CoA thioesterase
LTWSQVTEAAGYRIYRSTNNIWTTLDTYETNITGGSSTNWTDSNGAAGTNYYYITSYDTNTPYENESWFSKSINSRGYYAASNTNTGIEYYNIQTAIDEANENETVVIYPGTYFEELTLTGKTNISFIGKPWLDSSDRHSTVLNGNNVNKH